MKKSDCFVGRKVAWVRRGQTFEGTIREVGPEAVFIDWQSPGVGSLTDPLLPSSVGAEELLTLDSPTLKSSPLAERDTWRPSQPSPPNQPTIQESWEPWTAERGAHRGIWQGFWDRFASIRQERLDLEAQETSLSNQTINAFYATDNSLIALRLHALHVKAGLLENQARMAALKLDVSEHLETLLLPERKPEAVDPSSGVRAK